MGGHAFIDANAMSTLKLHSLEANGDRPEHTLTLVNTPSSIHFTSGHFLDGDRLLCSDEGMLIPGQHNRDNACLAYAAASLYGANTQALKNTIHQFSGLPYRLQYEGRHAGIDWINDSISTAPEAACAALEAFGKAGTATLIVGGQDRGYDYGPLLNAISDYQVAHVILIPESGSTIASLAENQTTKDSLAMTSQFHQTNSLSDAVKLAVKLTPQHGRCVFSPAAPSYHLWSGFEARGHDFRIAIHAFCS